MPTKILLSAGIPSYSFEVIVEGKTLNFRVRWNNREESWRLDIRDSSEDPIVQGLKLSPNQNLTRGYVDSRLPDGNFYIIDLSGKVTRPTFESLGDIQQLVFFTKEEEDELQT